MLSLVKASPWHRRQGPTAQESEAGGVLEAGTQPPELGEAIDSNPWHRLLAGSTHEHARHSLRKPDQDFVRLPGTTFVDQYMGYVTILAALAPVAFVVTEASRWVDDLSVGRAEVQLSIAGSRSRGVLDWALSAVAGIIVVSLALTAGCMVGAASAGVELRADSLMRTTAAAILLGSAICGVALLAVVVFRSGFAIGALAAALGVGFLLRCWRPCSDGRLGWFACHPPTLSGRHMRLY